MSSSHLEYLDSIAREAFDGNYTRVGVLSTGERLYVALASGRMRELAPSDSIPYAVRRVGDDWMEHMGRVWSNAGQPTVDRAALEAHGAVQDERSSAQAPDDPESRHLDMARTWAQDPSMRAVYVAAALQGYFLHPQPGGQFAVYWREGSSVKPAIGWADLDEVSKLCGLLNGSDTYRAAIERAGHTWPDHPEAFLRDHYNAHTRSPEAGHSFG